MRYWRDVWAVGFYHEAAVGHSAGGFVDFQSFGIGGDARKADKMPCSDHGLSLGIRQDPTVENGAQLSVPGLDQLHDITPAFHAAAVTLMDDDVFPNLRCQRQLRAEKFVLSCAVVHFRPAVWLVVIVIKPHLAQRDAARVLGQLAELLHPVGLSDLGDGAWMHAGGEPHLGELLRDLQTLTARRNVAADSHDSADARRDSARDNGGQFIAQRIGFKVSVSVGEHHQLWLGLPA